MAFNGHDVVIAGGIVESYGKFLLGGKELIIDGDVKNSCGTFYLEGGKMEVRGDFQQSDGEIFLSGGMLDITGDYRIQSGSEGSYGSCGGSLVMINEDDRARVGGDFYTSGDCHYFEGEHFYSVLTAGTLELCGNFFQTRSDDAFRASGTHRVVKYYFSRIPCWNKVYLNGTELQASAFGEFAVRIKETSSGKTAVITGYNGTAQSVSIPPQIEDYPVTEIGERAFKNCEKLKAVNFPISLKKIGYGAFMYCTSLEDIQIPMDVTEIGQYAFSGCSALQVLDIPVGVTMIDYGIFEGCALLEQLYIPASVVEIHSYFHDSDNLTLYVDPGSFAEQFAIENNLKYQYLTESISLEVSLSNENGETIYSNYNVYWYLNESEDLISTGKSLRNAADGLTYQYQIVLGEELSCHYFQPDKGVVTVAGKSQNINIQLTALPVFEFKGIVKDINDNPISNAKIVTKQTFNNQYERTNTITSSEEGFFSMTLMAVRMSITIMADGYYSSSYRLTEEDFYDTNFELKAFLYELPTNRITLTLRVKSAVEEGTEVAISTLTNTNGLSFELYNKTKDKAIENFSLQYPFIIINDKDVSPNDNIKIAVEDKKRLKTAEPIDITLDNNRCGNADIDFLENGHFCLKNITGTNNYSVFVFDENGINVSSGSSTLSSYSGPALPEGDYTIVLITKSSLLKNVDCLNRLMEYGLIASSDYTEIGVKISNGKTSVLDGLIVPDFDMSKLYFTIADNTFLTVASTTVVTGKYISIKSQYEIDAKHASSQQKVELVIPDGTTFVGGSLTVDGKKAEYTQNNNAVTVYVGASKGILRFYLLPTTSGLKQVAASLTFKKDNDLITQPIGSASFEVTAGSLRITSKTGRTTVTATGKAIENCEITVYDNGSEVGKTNSNKNGSWSLKFELIKPFSYSYHEIFAKVHSNFYDVEIETETSELLYDASYAMVSKATMINTAHPSNSLLPMEFRTDFDFLNPQNAVPQYNYWPDYPDFTFLVEFTGGDEEVLRNVNVVTTDSSGDKTYVKCTYDQKDKVWIGTQKYTNFADVPCKVNVIYKCDTDFIETELAEAIYQKNQDYVEINMLEDNSTINGSISWIGTLKDTNVTIPTTMYLSNHPFNKIDKSFFIKKGFDLVYESEDVLAFLNDETRMAQIIIPSHTNDSMIFECNIDSASDSIDNNKTNNNDDSNQTIALANRESNCIRCNTFTAEDLMRLAQEYLDESMAEQTFDIELENDIDIIRRMRDVARALVVFSAAANFPISSRGSGQAEQIGSLIGSGLFNAGPSIKNAANSITEAQQNAIDRLKRHLLNDCGKLTKCTGHKDCNCNGNMCYCQKEPIDDDGGEDCLPTADPSGYVYEAVPTNRVEGVEAKLYYYDYVLDDFGLPEDEKSEILWDAENYDQVNPQITNEQGVFAWDVPPGQWVVKFSKDGYEDADSYQDPAVDAEGYLPVPPIQTEVNTAIVSKAVPAVSNVKAYQEQIRIDFSQYMQIDTVNTTNVKVSIGGKNVQGTIEPLNAEDNYEKTTQYASSYAFIPDETLSGAVAVSVSGVKSYNGKAISDVYNQTADVTIMPRKLEITGGNVIGHHESAEMEIRILPAEAGASRTVTITSYSPSIVSAESQTVTTDEYGAAKVILNGKLPGEGILTVSLEGTDLSEEIKVLVKAKETVFALEDFAGQITFETDSFVYTGSQITPAVTIPGLTEGTDFTVAYSDNVKVGTATATITGIGKYTGTITKTFVISPASVSKAEVTGIKAKTYNGKAQTQSPVVKVGDRTLENKTDYTLSYKNNTIAGTATVTIKGTGNYTGSISKTFVINPSPVSGAEVAGIKAKTYNGKAQTQAPVVKVGGRTLKDKTDYTLSYKNNTNAGTATVMIKGKGNYTGSIAKTFKINKAAQKPACKTSLVSVGKTGTFTITGSKGKLTVTSADKKIATISKIDQSKKKVTVKGVKVGSVKLTIKSAAAANFNAGSVTVTLKIVPAATAKITADNQAKGIKLTWAKVAGANGYIVYRNNKKIKTITKGATVTFTDTAANTNGTKYTYKIVAKASTGNSTLSKSLAAYRVASPAVKTLKNSASKKMTVSWGKNAKANGYQIQYSTSSKFKSGNKTANITKAGTVSKVIGSLAKGKTYYVRIRTYKTVGKTKYWSSWSASKKVKISK